MRLSPSTPRGTILLGVALVILGSAYAWTPWMIPIVIGGVLIGFGVAWWTIRRATARMRGEL